jgi:hypothetical protein
MIKLKEELKNINSNKLNKIKKIAKQMRSELESNYDWEADKGCFKNTCSHLSEELANKLKAEGIYAYPVHGLYYGAPDTYEPDMDDWSGDEVDEYFDSKSYGEPFGFNHWWVVAGNKYIIDITADQFHIDEPEEYRVVISDIGDSDYSV